MKPRILVFTDWYLPGYKGGGPIRSIAALVRALRDEFDFAIVTSDTDFTDTQPYAGIRNDEWNVLPDGTRVFYARRAAFEPLIASEPFDAAYFNSVFSRDFTLRPLRLVRRLRPDARVILAPRGMLGAGALRIKPWRKRAFLIAARLAGWFRNVAWHASSDLEAAEVRAQFGSGCTIRVAPNLSLLELNGWRDKAKTPGEARFIFLSRISPKKNLATAIRLLGKTGPAAKVHLDVFGPVDDSAYAAECRRSIAGLPPHVTVTWHGPVPHAGTAAALASAHFLLLPTLHENFGHVIVEAFAASCPVLISDRTPWHDLHAQKLGWDTPADFRAWEAAIDSAVRMDAGTYREFSTAAYSRAERHVRDPALLEANRRVFAPH